MGITFSAAENANVKMGKVSDPLLLENAGGCLARAWPPADGSLLVSSNPVLTRALYIHSSMHNTSYLQL